MGQLLVRGLDDGVIEALRQRARLSGQSVEAEHRAILEQALPVAQESFAEAAARLRREGPRQTTDSAAIIREFRDRNRQMED
jgi:plasmid stability protein